MRGLESKTNVQWVNMSETNCEAKKDVWRQNWTFMLSKPNINDKVKYSLSGFKKKTKIKQLRSARIKVNAVSYIECFGVWITTDLFGGARHWDCAISSVWYFNVCGHFILALQTSSANSRSSVTTLIISKLTRHPAFRIKSSWDSSLFKVT